MGGGWVAVGVSEVCWWLSVKGGERVVGVGGGCGVHSEYNHTI